MSYCKYKDAPPKMTIKRIKECFRSIGIELEEKIIERMEGIYSSTVIDQKTGWAASGKGTTKEYCLASGYAEAMEHFCSYCAYDFSLVSVESKKYLDFYRYPDEKLMDISNFSEIIPFLYEDIKEAFSLDGNVFSEAKAIDAWTKFLKSNEVSLVPYYSVRNNKMVYLPEAILGKLCGSTGGGAGNTPEEAIGHALDEISERYAKYVIYSQELTPPEINREFIEASCPELYRTISLIEEGGLYKVLVKDASLGKNYPVIAVCLINQETQSYVVNFGAHPIFAIALERCLTEMFQFMSLQYSKSTRHKKMTKWSSFETETHSIRNWTSLLRDDTGVVPDAFFVGDKSWEFKTWGFYNEYSNKEGMKQQINNFLNDNVKDIYIRDVGFLGFPVYRVYIPDYSVSHFTINDKTMSLFDESSLLVESIFNETIFKLNAEDIVMLKETFSKKTYVGTWILRSLNEDYLDLLLAALVKESEGNKAALELLLKIDSDFTDAILQDVNMSRQKRTIEERNQIIDLFYSQFIVDIVKIWRNENTFICLLKLYKEYKLMPVKQCQSYVEPIQNVYKNMKKRMVEKLPIQECIKNIIN